MRFYQEQPSRALRMLEHDAAAAARKLSDFGRGMKTGEDITVLTEPYGRLLEAF
jgi:hypothetical protein